MIVAPDGLLRPHQVEVALDLGRSAGSPAWATRTRWRRSSGSARAAAEPSLRASRMMARRSRSRSGSRPTLSLPAAMPWRCRHAAVVGAQFLVRQRHVQPAGVGRDPAGARAQLAPQRHPVLLGAQVPQRAVERRDGAADGAAGPALEDEALHELDGGRGPRAGRDRPAPPPSPCTIGCAAGEAMATPTGSSSVSRKTATSATTAPRPGAVHPRWAAGPGTRRGPSERQECAPGTPFLRGGSGAAPGIRRLPVSEPAGILATPAGWQW